MNVVILHAVVIAELSKRNHNLSKELDRVRKTLRKTQGLLVSSEKDREQIERDWEKETKAFNKGWSLAESGKLPEKKDPAPVWDGYRSKKYSILVEEINELKHLLAETLEKEDSDKEKTRKISELSAELSMRVHELASVKDLLNQSEEEVRRLHSLVDELYNNSSRIDTILRDEEKKVREVTLQMESTEKALEVYKASCLLGPKARLLLGNLVMELKGRNLGTSDFASLLRIDTSVAEVLWDILKGNNNDSVSPVKPTS